MDGALSPEAIAQISKLIPSLGPTYTLIVLVAFLVLSSIGVWIKKIRSSSCTSTASVDIEKSDQHHHHSSEEVDADSQRKSR